jgi:hypothetical protein
MRSNFVRKGRHGGREQGTTVGRVGQQARIDRRPVQERTCSPGTRARVPHRGFNTTESTIANSRRKEARWRAEGGDGRSDSQQASVNRRRCPRPACSSVHEPVVPQRRFYTLLYGMVLESNAVRSAITYNYGMASTVPIRAESQSLSDHDNLALETSSTVPHQATKYIYIYGAPSFPWGGDDALLSRGDDDAESVRGGKPTGSEAVWDVSMRTHPECVCVHGVPPPKNKNTGAIILPSFFVLMVRSVRVHAQCVPYWSRLAHAKKKNYFRCIVRFSWSNGTSGMASAASTSASGLSSSSGVDLGDFSVTLRYE